MSIRAVQIDRHGGVDVLQVRRLPEPEAGDGQALVRTIASSINPVDSKTRALYSGHGLKLPMTMGWDLAGVIVQSRVPRLRPGDRIIAMSHQYSTGVGTWADLVALPADSLAPAPADWSLAEAAALPLAGSTALQALDSLGAVAGQRILVVGAAGSVGSLFAQLATGRDAIVDAVVSRPGHLRQARRSLADGIAVHDGSALPPHAYDVVFDTAGISRARIEPAGLLTGTGQYLSIVDDPLPDLPQARKIQVRPDGASLAELVRLAGLGRLRVQVADQFPLRAVRLAHRRAERGGLLGKVILDF